MGQAANQSWLLKPPVMSVSSYWTVVTAVHHPNYPLCAHRAHRTSVEIDVVNNNGSY